jgi:hypothetical protein
VRACSCSAAAGQVGSSAAAPPAEPSALPAALAPQAKQLQQAAKQATAQLHFVGRSALRLWSEEEVDAREELALEPNLAADTFGTLLTGSYSKLQAKAAETVGLEPGEPHAAASLSHLAGLQLPERPAAAGCTAEPHHRGGLAPTCLARLLRALVLHVPDPCSPLAPRHRRCLACRL